MNEKFKVCCAHSHPICSQTFCEKIFSQSLETISRKAQTINYKQTPSLLSEFFNEQIPIQNEKSPFSLSSECGEIWSTISFERNPFSLFNEIGSMINISSRFWLSRCIFRRFQRKITQRWPKEKWKAATTRAAVACIFNLPTVWENYKDTMKTGTASFEIMPFFPSYLVLSHCFGFAFLIYTFFHCLRAASLWATTFLRSIDCFFQFRSSAEPPADVWFVWYGMNVYLQCTTTKQMNSLSTYSTDN